MRTTTASKAELKETSKSTMGHNLLVITFRISLILTIIVLVSIAVWAVLALFGGMVSAGDPLTLIKGWINAITGH